MSVNGNADAPGLRAQRKAAKLSQERLAAIAGCSSAMVKLLENGYAPQHSGVLPRLLEVLADERAARGVPSTSEATGATSDGFAKTSVGALDGALQE